MTSSSSHEPPPPDGDAGRQGSTPAGELSGISELFGLGHDDSAAIPDGSAERSDGWVAATEGTSYDSADPSGRLMNGRYRLIAQLSSGGMGVTYRAWDTHAGIPVVVKMPKREVRRDKEVMARFAREIEAMRAVPHESIVPITDSGDDNGCPFVVMRFLPGGSLADYRRWNDSGAPKKNPPGMLHFWLKDMASALDHIHARRMLHRDVKPGNVFLDGFLKPYLGDFGIAKVVDDSGGLEKEQTLTATRMAVGTPEYMAPELFRPRVQPDGRVDQYALAVTVYEMLSGEKPFTGSTENIVVEHASLPVPPLETKCPGLRPSVYAAVHKALAKNPEERFTTCEEFAVAVLAEIKPLEPEVDTVRLLCPSCRNILKLPQRSAGKKGRCPRCHSAMDVAADLGSLWLESEERGAAVAVESSGLPQVLKQDPIATTRSQTWRGITWATVAGAMCVGLVAVCVWGYADRQSLVQRAVKTIDELHADEIQILQAAINESRASLAAATRKVEELQQQLEAKPKPSLVTPVNATYSVSSTSGWQAGPTVVAGQTYNIAASGSVVWESGGSTCGPDGFTPDFSDANFVSSIRPHEALIGKVGSGGMPFLIGSSYSVTASTSDMLYFATNDIKRGDNSGSFSVNVQSALDEVVPLTGEARLRKTVVVPHQSDSVSDKLKEAFAASGWSVEQAQATAQELPERCLVTIVGGSFHDQEGFLPEESEAIATHIRGGGALLAAGLSWPWTEVAYGGKPAETFPLNQLGQRLGFVIPAGYAKGVRLPQRGLLQGLSREQLNFIGMVPSCVSVTAPDYETFLEDEEGNAIIVGFRLGKGRIVVCGHPGMLEGDPEVLRRIVRYLLHDTPTGSTQVVSDRNPVKARAPQDLLHYTFSGDQPATADEAKQMLLWLGAAITAEEAAGQSVTGRLGPDLEVTIWPRTYEKDYCYGIRSGIPLSAYWGSNDTYFEVCRRQ